MLRTSLAITTQHKTNKQTKNPLNYLKKKNNFLDEPTDKF